jgi:preprotein translocase subunit SecD
MFSLNEEGGSRVFSWTSKNVGKTLTAKMDNEELMVAQVAGPFRSRFQTTVNISKEETYRIARIIRSGPLKTKVTVKDYRVHAK